jgi:hypothetical protein
VQQDQRPPGASAQIAHAGATKIHPALFNALTQGRSGLFRDLLNITHQSYPLQNLSRAEDNSFPPTAFYLSETTPLSLHFGELRLPAFLGVCIKPSELVILKRAHFAR